MMTLAELRRVLEAAPDDLPAADLADAIGACAAAQARLLARLTAPPPAAEPPNELVTAEVVAERFHLAVSSVHELARQGRLPHRMFGRYRRFSLAEVAGTLSDSKTVSLGTERTGQKAA